MPEYALRAPKGHRVQPVTPHGMPMRSFVHQMNVVANRRSANLETEPASATIARSTVPLLRVALNRSARVAQLADLSTRLRESQHRGHRAAGATVQLIRRSNNKKWNQSPLKEMWSSAEALYEQAKSSAASIKDAALSKEISETLRALDERPVAINEIDGVLKQLEALISRIGVAPVTSLDAEPVEAATAVGVSPPASENTLRSALRRQRALARGMSLADVDAETLKREALPRVREMSLSDVDAKPVAGQETLSVTHSTPPGALHEAGPFDTWWKRARELVAATTLQSVVRGHLTRRAVFRQQAEALAERVSAWPHDFTREARLRAITAAGREFVGPTFRWLSTPNRSEYDLILQHQRLRHVATLEERETNKAAFIARFKAIDADARLTLPAKLARLRTAVQYFECWVRTFEIIRDLASKLAAHLQQQALASYTLDMRGADVAGGLDRHMARGLVRVGTLRRHYKSSHDQREQRAFGAAYELLNTPYVVHVHYDSGGTRLAAVSIKTAHDDPPGTAVLKDHEIDDDLWKKLRIQVESAAVTPKQIAAERAKK